MKQDVGVLLTPRNVIAQFSRIKLALARAKDPTTLTDIERTLERIEGVMRAAGMFPFEKLAPVNAIRTEAWAKLGRALAKIAPGHGPGRGRKVPGGRDLLLKDLGLATQRVTEFERIGRMPDGERLAFIKRLHAVECFVYAHELVREAKPYWYKERRNQRHQEIQRKAEKRQIAGDLGPFPLLYADPPWTFYTFTAKGHESHRMPEDHYPVMSDDEIISIKFGGKTIQELAHQDAAIFMWCTSSNIRRAMNVMDAWGFDYKTHAVWDKERIGLGLVFRNQHEILLYGDRGKMPKPALIPASVFRYKGTKHSRKPPEIRETLGRMYPFFDAQTRCELFCRGQFDGWTCLGFEADA